MSIVKLIGWNFENEWKINQMKWVIGQYRIPHLTNLKGIKFFFSLITRSLITTKKDDNKRNRDKSIKTTEILKSSRIYTNERLKEFSQLNLKLWACECQWNGKLMMPFFLINLYYDSAARKMKIGYLLYAIVGWA